MWGHASQAKACEFEKGLFLSPEFGKSPCGMIGLDYRCYLVFIEAIATKIHIQFVWNGLYIAADRLVADNAKGGMTAMAQAEMDFRMIFERWFTVAAENEFGHLGDSIFLFQSLHEQQADGDRE